MRLNLIGFSQKLLAEARFFLPSVPTAKAVGNSNNFLYTALVPSPSFCYTRARGSDLSRGTTRAFYVPNATTIYENRKVSQDDCARNLRRTRLRRRLARADGRGRARTDGRWQAIRRTGQGPARAPGNS